MSSHDPPLTNAHNADDDDDMLNESLWNMSIREIPQSTPHKNKSLISEASNSNYLDAAETPYEIEEDNDEDEKDVICANESVILIDESPEKENSFGSNITRDVENSFTKRQSAGQSPLFGTPLSDRNRRISSPPSDDSIIQIATPSVNRTRFVTISSEDEDDSPTTTNRAPSVIPISSDESIIIDSDTEGPTQNSEEKKKYRLADIDDSALFETSYADDENIKKTTVDAQFKNAPRDFQLLLKQAESCPTEEDLAETPTALTVELLNHQQRAVRWMLWRESKLPRGGILGDEMGLGKTVSMLGMILARGQQLDEMDPDDYENVRLKRKRQADGLKVRPSFSTLIVLPVSLLTQWEAEINDKVQEDHFDVLLFYGNDRNKISDKKLAKADIVLTTYGTLKSDVVEKTGRKYEERHGSKLMGIYWDRIVLDEAHEIRNKNTAVSIAVGLLHAERRWLLTGTPLHNSVNDIYPMIRFLHFHPWDELNTWKSRIETSKDRNSRLNILMRVIMLRRRKLELEASKELVLPPRINLVHQISQSPIEKKVYHILLQAAKVQVEQYLQNRHEADGFVVADDAMEEGGGGSEEEWNGVNPFLAAGRDDCVKMAQLFVYMTRLRQTAVHFCLGRDALDLNAFDDMRDRHVTRCPLQKKALEEKRRDLEESVNEEEDEEEEEEIGVEELFEPERKSSKFVSVLAKIEEICEGGEQCVVVSQWVGVLNLLSSYLRSASLRFLMLNGSLKSEERLEVIKKFRAPSNAPPILLLSLTAGGVGLNLVNASHILFIDSHWNPQMEEQACCRIYRIGQKRDVYIHRFMAVGTFEERVMQLQKVKIDLADEVVEGKGKSKTTKLTADDLRFLFDIGK